MFKAICFWNYPCKLGLGQDPVPHIWTMSKIKPFLLIVSLSQALLTPDTFKGLQKALSIIYLINIIERLHTPVSLRDKIPAEKRAPDCSELLQ